MYRTHSTCRACGYGSHGPSYIKAAAPNRLIEVFDLGVQPLANDFQSPESDCAGCAPLRVLHCQQCSLAQLSVTVDPRILYSHYSYVTSPSEMMQVHFRTLIQDIMSETRSAVRVLEIGSNDGKLLAMLRSQGHEVTGVDPAKNLVEISQSKGITTHHMLFTCENAAGLDKYDVVIARHVFCHVDDWLDFMNGLQMVSDKNTLICIETPYLGDLLEKCEFDTIYHEHLSYLPIKAMQALLARTGFRMHRLIRYSIHGGAYLWMIVREDCQCLSPFQDVQENIGLDQWRDFSARAHSQINALDGMVNDLVSKGKRVAGLGASAKSTVWINACNFSRRQIGFIADNTQQKLYKLSPGTDIPIVDEGAILRELPDYVVLWAWNYRDEILDKFKMARDKGVKFIVPVPTIEVV